MKKGGGEESCEEERNERMKKNKWFCLLDVTDVVDETTSFSITDLTAATDQNLNLLDLSIRCFVYKMSENDDIQMSERRKEARNIHI